MKRSVQLIFGVLLALLLIEPGQAGAAPATQHFMADASAAGLSHAQVDWLQRAVDTYLSKTEGKQTSPNTIDLNGTGEVQIALPGEQHPRDFAHPGSRLPDPCAGGTALGYVCAYSDAWGAGSIVAGYYCNQNYYLNQDIFWNTFTGSWGSNQYGGAQGAFFTPDGHVADWIPEQGNNQNYSWVDHQVKSFIPCGL
ncbi:hypothetical protein QRX50_31540 [Amycolatopsis carbonis]|uniref:Uncharacterized protein n=1 Tax=Amycolatopsis carbonis TaxID=715471 RepID=A0A9Y2IAH4_9PSEU|nr:hypothetical protein [Amycolatopsis sp. 2-15]WIX75994.1 hypothetical protein QRX50_31540 [Amycolatopsis sp. 2-15]